MTDIDTAKIRHECEPWGAHDFDAEIVLALCDEVDRLRQHSVILNSTTYLAAQALGRVVPPADYEGDPKETVFALVEENIKLRAKLVAAREEVWRLILDEEVWAADTRNLRRILSDD